MENYLVRELTHYCNISVPFCCAIHERVISYFDFTYVLEGSMTYIVDGKEVALGRGDAVFLRPGTRRARKEGNAPVRYVSFNFHLFDGVELPFENFLKNCISPDTKRLFSLFSQDHLSARFHSEQKCVNLLNYILFELLDTKVLRSQNVHVRALLVYIEEHLGEPLSLKHLAEHAGLSPEYTSTIFKRETGKTVTEYINEKRLLLAKEEICNTRRPLREIAARTGFENYHYFCRLFKEHFGTTPTKTRKRTEIIV